MWIYSKIFLSPFVKEALFFFSCVFWHFYWESGGHDCVGLFLHSLFCPMSIFRHIMKFLLQWLHSVVLKLSTVMFPALCGMTSLSLVFFLFWCSLILLIHVFIVVVTVLPLPPLMLLFVIWGKFHCILKYFLSHLSYPCWATVTVF